MVLLLLVVDYTAQNIMTHKKSNESAWWWWWWWFVDKTTSYYYVRIDDMIGKLNTWKKAKKKLLKFQIWKSGQKRKKGEKIITIDDDDDLNVCARERAHHHHHLNLENLACHIFFFVTIYKSYKLSIKLSLWTIKQQQSNTCDFFYYCKKKICDLPMYRVNIRAHTHTYKVITRWFCHQYPWP